MAKKSTPAPVEKGKEKYITIVLILLVVISSIYSFYSRENLEIVNLRKELDGNLSIVYEDKPPITLVSKLDEYDERIKNAEVDVKEIKRIKSSVEKLQINISQLNEKMLDIIDKEKDLDDIYSQLKVIEDKAKIKVEEVKPELKNISKIIEGFHEWKEEFNHTVSVMNQNFTTAKSFVDRLQHTSVNLEQSLIGFNTKLQDMDAKQTNLQNTIDANVNTTEDMLENLIYLLNISVNLNASVATIEKQLRKLSLKLGDYAVIGDRIEHIIKKKGRLNISLKFLNTVVDTLTKNVSQIEKTVHDQFTTIVNLSLALQHMEANVSTLGNTIDEIQTLTEILGNQIAEHSSLIEKYRAEFPSVTELNKQIFVLASEVQTGRAVLLGVVVAYILLTMMLVCTVYKNTKMTTDMKRKISFLVQNKDAPLLQFESLGILEKIKRRQEVELENKYCVVSFSPDTHHRHRRITRACVEGRRREKNMTETDLVIKDHKSILGLPPVRVMLIFVDHNQKDIILETPGQGTDDIKLLTVQACRKIGADVFVVYVGDAGSEKLMPGLLYNPQLTTVSEHFELKQLEQRDRVITVHERFTITQREKVAEAIA